MNFGQAIEALKAGERVAREGWNGKGMWLALAMPRTKGFTVGMGIDARAHVTIGIDPHWFPRADAPEVRPCIVMLDATGMLVPGWLASQTDMLAEDWRLVE